MEHIFLLLKMSILVCFLPRRSYNYQSYSSSSSSSSSSTISSNKKQTCFNLVCLLYVLLVFRSTKIRIALRAGAAQGQESVASTRRGPQSTIFASGMRSGAGLVPRTTPFALPPMPCWYIAVPTGVPTAHGPTQALHAVPVTWQSIAVPTGGLPAHGP